MARIQNTKYVQGFLIFLPSLMPSYYFGPKEDWEQYKEDYEEYLRQKREPQL